MNVNKIYKLCHITKESRTLYVFSGYQHEKMDLNTMFINNPDIEVFRSMFNESEIEQIRSSNTKVVFFTDIINDDDTIYKIKCKICDVLLNNVSESSSAASSSENVMIPSELYLFTKKIRKIHPFLGLFKNKIYTKSELAMIFQNIDDTENFRKLEIDYTSTDVFDKAQIYNIFFKERNHIKSYIENIPLTFRFIDSSVKYMVDPYNYNEFPNKAYMKLNSAFETMDNQCLLEFGSLKNNTIYFTTLSQMMKDHVALHNHVLNGISEDETSKHLHIECFIRLYYPFIAQQEMTSVDAYHKRIEEERFKFDNSIIQYVREISNTQQEISAYANQKVNLITISVNNFKVLYDRPKKNIKLSLENIFKGINSSKRFPIIKLNLGRGHENLYRLHSNKFKENGEKVPFLRRPVINKFIRKTTQPHTISAILNDNKDNTTIVQLKANGQIFISCHIQKNTILAPNKILMVTKNAITAFIELISDTNVQFTKYFDTTIDEDDIHCLSTDLRITSKISRELKFDNFPNCVKPYFNIKQPNITKGAILRYKNVSNYRDASVYDSFIMEKVDGNTDKESIAKMMSESFENLNIEKAKSIVDSFMENFHLQTSMFSNRIILSKNNPGFTVSINIVSNETIEIVLNNINNFAYIPNIIKKVKNLIYISQKNDTNSPSLMRLCKKDISVEENKIQQSNEIGPTELPQQPNNAVDNSESSIVRSNESSTDEYDFLFDDGEVEDDGDDGNNAIPQVVVKQTEEYDNNTNIENSNSPEIRTVRETKPESTNHESNNIEKDERDERAENVDSIPIRPEHQNAEHQNTNLPTTHTLTHQTDKVNNQDNNDSERDVRDERHENVDSNLIEQEHQLVGDTQIEHIENENKFGNKEKENEFNNNSNSESNQENNYSVSGPVVTYQPESNFSNVESEEETNNTNKGRDSIQTQSDTTQNPEEQPIEFNNNSNNESDENYENYEKRNTNKPNESDIGAQESQSAQQQQTIEFNNNSNNNEDEQNQNLIAFNSNIESSNIEGSNNDIDYDDSDEDEYEQQNDNDEPQQGGHRPAQQPLFIYGEETNEVLSNIFGSISKIKIYKAVLKGFVKIFCEKNDNFDSTIINITPYENMNVYGNLVYIPSKSLDNYKNYKKSKYPGCKLVEVETKDLNKVEIKHKTLVCIHTDNYSWVDIPQKHYLDKCIENQKRNWPELDEECKFYIRDAAGYIRAIYDDNNQNIEVISETERIAQQNEIYPRSINLKKHNFFLSRLEKHDPTLFVKQKNDDSSFFYSRACEWNARRQPVVLTKEEKRQIDLTSPGTYDGALKYSTEEGKELYYICPRYWNFKTNKPMKPSEVNPENVIDENASEVTDLSNKFIFEFKGKGKNYKPQYPGVLESKTDKNKHPKGFCVPCCFSKYFSKEQMKKIEKCTKSGTCKPSDFSSSSSSPSESSTSSDSVNSTTTNMTNADVRRSLSINYVLGPDSFPVARFRKGLLPKNVSEFLNFNSDTCLTSRTGTRRLKSKTPCLIRYGVEYSEKASFIACIASVYSDYDGSQISIKQMREKIASLIHIDNLQTYNNGNLLQTFDNQNYDDININDYREYRMYQLYHQTQPTLLKQLINATNQFKSFLLDDELPLDYKYLWDILCEKNRNLFVDGLNIVIMVDEQDDSTNKISLVCPSNAFTKSYFSPSKPSLILYKRGNIYEPIVYYEETREHKIVQKLHLINESTMKELHAFLIKIRDNQIQQCYPKKSEYKDFVYKMNRPASYIIDILAKKKIKVLKQLLNMRSKVIACVVQIDGLRGKIPTYPSNINPNIPYEVNSNEYTLNYEDTVSFLTKIHSVSQGTIPCSPVTRVIDNGLVIGILTLTNQMVELVEPELVQVEDNLSELRYDRTERDLNAITQRNDVQNITDTPEYEVIHRIEQENGFYRLYKLIMIKHLEEMENIELLHEVQSISTTHELSYMEKMEKLKNLLGIFMQQYVVFIGDNDEDNQKLLDLDMNKAFRSCEKQPQFCNNDSRIIMPKYNLFNNNHNEVMYINYICDGIIRNSFFFSANHESSRTEYDVGDNEILISETSIQADSFRNLTNNIGHANTYALTYNQVQSNISDGNINDDRTDDASRMNIDKIANSSIQNIETEIEEESKQDNDEIHDRLIVRNIPEPQTVAPKTIPDITENAGKNNHHQNSNQSTSEIQPQSSDSVALELPKEPNTVQPVNPTPIIPKHTLRIRPRPHMSNKQVLSPIQENNNEMENSPVSYDSNKVTSGNPAENVVQKNEESNIVESRNSFDQNISNISSQETNNENSKLKIGQEDKNQSEPHIEIQHKSDDKNQSEIQGNVNTRHTTNQTTADIRLERREVNSGAAENRPVVSVSNNASKNKPKVIFSGPKKLKIKKQTRITEPIYESITKEHRCAKVGYLTDIWEEIFPEPSRYLHFHADVRCNFMLIKEIMKAHDYEKYKEITDIKLKNNYLIPLYQKYRAFKETIILAWKKQTKYIESENLKRGDKTTDEIIVDENYTISEIDILLLSLELKIPIAIFYQARNRL